MHETPKHNAYDVVIIGGAMMGSAVAFFLSNRMDFDGRILIVEKDPTFKFAATSHTNSCIRQQFSNPLNIAISRFGAEHIRNFRTHLGDDDRVPQPLLQDYGYLYLADNQETAAQLEAACSLQQSLGAQTRILGAEALHQAFPFFNLDGIVCGSHNTKDEGYFEGQLICDWWRRKAKEAGVETVCANVCAINRNANHAQSITLENGTEISTGFVVNAAGTGGIAVAAMVGIALPIEPRKRYTYVFSAETPLETDLPLTIDPSGIHVRSDGVNYLAGATPDHDPEVDPADFRFDHTLWQEKVWPILADRIPAFERIRIINEWVGHYDFNTLDQNAIIGPHPELGNFIFMNGFSGHGLQQSPAMGRGVAEWITHNEYRSIDLAPFGYQRIMRGEPFVEKAVI